MANSHNSVITYGDIITLFELCEQANPGDKDYLCREFEQAYPNIHIGRPGRFYDTVLRIIAPTRSSIRGGRSLNGSQLNSYCKRIWTPRIRGQSHQGHCTFPDILLAYGLTEELLSDIYHQVVERKKPSDKWQLQEIPNVGFYQQLHSFVKKWYLTCNATKATVGLVYLSIDSNLREKGGRPDNIYRFVDKLSDKKPAIPMPYCHFAAVNTMKREITKCNEHIQALSTEVSELREQLQQSREQLETASNALCSITKEADMHKRKCCTAQKKVVKLQESQALNKADISKLLEENADFSVASSGNDKDTQSNIFVSKHGTQFTPAIRKLYYSLLTKQVPASNIERVVRTVIKSVNPLMDIDQIILPKRSCASYMRRDELKTISNAHKAMVLCDDIRKNKGFNINTDGTTKQQRKLGGTAINGMVISVNELSDGSASSTITDISQELEQLRCTAKALKIPNANSINWTMLVSSTSDSASTEKKLNKLIEENRARDEKRFGAATLETTKIIENFCSMHLGVNLRKAFLSGMVSDPSTGAERAYHPVDTFVHEFAKLFGKHGTPEYGLGSISFPDFLALMCTDANANTQSHLYYQCCASITLERQVGSRYFVTAANAAKIFFLKEAAVEYLKYNSKDAGNKLEQEVFKKLSDPEQLAMLKCDALMYYHVYADLVMLSKSTDLNKSALDMNIHYLELKSWLQEIEQYPEVVMEKSYRVFQSESDTLYGSNKKLNHRLHKISLAVHERLLQTNENEASLLYPLLMAGAVKMKEKLCTYAANQLPGGTYWDPVDPKIREVLTELQPSNDFCESILGLNDYLTTAIPNLNQMSRSNLIEIKKNHTMEWLDDLPTAEQNNIMKLAVKSRATVQREVKSRQIKVARERQEKMRQAHFRREALKKKATLEKDKLSKFHLITSSEELHQLLSEIDTSSNTTSKKKVQKFSLLRTQINIRRKVLGQDIHITFSHLRKQRPLNTVIQELSDYLDRDLATRSKYVQDPSTMVGKNISHLFKINKLETKWFTGTVLAYDHTTKIHKIQYDGEDDQCQFDLNIDLLSGDIKIID